MSLLPFEKIKRKIIIINKSTTNPEYGGSPEEKNVAELINAGVINLNKPRGPRSHQVSEFVQRILKIKKAGHGGTLDPHVTGVLPIALGDSTKIVQFLLTAGKEYICLMKLHKNINEEEIKRACLSMTGKIKQLPPQKSSVVRQWREREIYYTDILEIKNRDVLLKIGCQAGTYIRKYIHDLGVLMNVGANMAELVRTKAGSFNDSNWITLQDLEDAYYLWKEHKNEKPIRKCIYPVEYATSHLAKVWVQDSAVDSICHGANLNIPGLTKIHSDIQVGDAVAIMTLKDELIAVGPAQLSSEKLSIEKRGMAVRTQRVFMKPGIYAKQSK